MKIWLNDTVVDSSGVDLAPDNWPDGFGVFETIKGDIRVVGEMDEYGLLHIFNEDQLEHYGKDEPDLLNEAYMGYYWIMGDKIKFRH